MSNYFLPWTEQYLRWWLAAFVLTQLLEMPIYIWALRGRSWWQRGAIAFGASALTHPLVWFAFPWYAQVPMWVVFWSAEIFAVSAEAMYFRAWGLPHYWRWAIAANALSAATGELLLWYWPQLLRSW